MTLDNFIHKIPDFDSLSAGERIEYFVYYKTILEGKDGVKAKEIDDCFDSLKIVRYSNTPQYLHNYSISGKLKKPKFIIQNGLYHLERSKKAEIDRILRAPIPIIPSDSYFPLELFKGTRGYLEAIAAQAATCYDHSLYDACSVMTRKLLEVLLIESFERYNISAKIKNSGGDFYFLSDLIEMFTNEKIWNIGRNSKSVLQSLKKMGDLSAHNRRYVARKMDLDKLKDNLRIVLEELIHIIDYPSWK